MITNVKCWACDTVYNYGKHEYCPICEAHWIDGSSELITELEPGDRVSVVIDYNTEQLTPLNER